jgi:hypothetical protein
LSHGEQLVVDEQPGEVRMLGAVRAAKQCLDCHEVPRGELLGAFSYRLYPTDRAGADTDGLQVDR